MKVVVLVKHVPDVQSDRAIADGRIVRGDDDVLNELDENAVEAAVSIVEEHGGETIAVTMGPEDAVEVPAEDHRLDWEGELCVVIGSGGRRLSEEQATDAIAGYAIANDISMRGWQGRTAEWTQGKIWEASTPVGPWVVTPDEFDASARLETRVNDEVVQADSVGNTVFTPAALVAYLSTMVTLSPGDLVLTGTPAGVALGRRNAEGRHPWMGKGDVIEVTIEGLGAQRTELV